MLIPDTKTSLWHVPRRIVEKREAQGLIGLFANLLMLRSDLSSDPTVRELIGRVRARVLDAYANQDTNLQQLLLELGDLSITLSHISQLFFALQMTPLPPATSLTGLTVSLLNLEKTISRFQLSLYIWERAGTFTGDFEYATDCFDKEAIKRLSKSYLSILENFYRNPQARIADCRQAVANTLLAQG